MGASLGAGVSALTVFFEGILSFFSPCVLPLLPVYIGYLSGGTGEKDAQGNIRYNRGRVMLHTVCFILGISVTFFLLGMGFSVIAGFFNDSRIWIARIGGVIVILFGLYELGCFQNLRFLGKERRISFTPNESAMSPLMALVMGFTFSFAWTPCIGPVLAGVLLMASASDTFAVAMGLIALYTLGFVLPFLAVGLFTSTLLNFFRAHAQVVKITGKICGVLLILMGVLMLTGQVRDLSAALSGTDTTTEQVETADEETGRETKESESTGQTKGNLRPEIDFTLTDQYGEEHTLSDYKGKTVFLNFWATWCGPCRSEMPDIQQVYEEYEPEGDVVILGVASPNANGEGSEEEVADFLEENGYTYPVLMDEGGFVQTEYQISAIPTTYMIDKDGYIYRSASGTLSREMMEKIIVQTMEGS